MDQLVVGRVAAEDQRREAVDQRRRRERRLGPHRDGLTPADLPIVTGDPHEEQVPDAVAVVRFRVGDRDRRDADDLHEAASNAPLAALR